MSKAPHLSRRRPRVANWRPLAVEITLVVLVTLAIFVAALAGIGAARAADAAERGILGFDSSGSVFAYEQYGRRDGSGFPYADIFYIATGTDQWAYYPIRVLIRNERRSVRHARDVARRRAGGPRAVRHYTFPGRLAETGNRTTRVLPNPDNPCATDTW